MEDDRTADAAAGDAQRRRDAVLRAFLQPDGTLRSIPSRHGKRLVLLDVLAGEFDIGVRYAESEVNDRLRRFHPDVAALRRYLVDDGLMEREGGVYWRAGGTVEV